MLQHVKAYEPFQSTLSTAKKADYIQCFARCFHNKVVDSHTGRMATRIELGKCHETTSSGKALRTHRKSTGYYGFLRVFYGLGKAGVFLRTLAFTVIHGFPTVCYGFSTGSLSRARKVCFFG